RLDMPGPATLIDGQAIAAEITQKVAEEAATCKQAGRRPPALAVVLIGHNPASQASVRRKGMKAGELGLHSVQHDLPASTSQAELLDLVGHLNEDPAIHGILVQLPLPGHIDTSKVIEAIRPEKDVDGFHPINVGRLVSGEPEKALVSCTPA